MRRFSSALTALAIGLVLLTAVDYAASATTGKPFILGKLNQASKATELQNTGKGAALELKNKSAYPPLKVNSTKKVSKLNADQVDGKSAGDLGVATGVVDLQGFHGTGATPSSPFLFELGEPGSYLVSFSANVSVPDSAGAYATCWLTRDVTFQNYAYSSAPQVSTVKGLSATVVLTSPGQYYFRCSATGAWSLLAGSQLVVTRITNATFN